MKRTMWKCANCGEEHEDQFDSCWKCSGSRTAEEPSDDGGAMESEAPAPGIVRETWPVREEVDDYKFCQRCGLPLELYGQDRLRHGADFAKSFFGTYVDAWKCPRCKRVEFYACE